MLTKRKKELEWEPDYMINQLYKQRYGVLYQQLNIDLSINSIWFGNQWFDHNAYTWRWFLSGLAISGLFFNKHTWIWFVSSFVISVLTSKSALQNDYCFVLQSVIWPQTHTWRWFLSGFRISDLSSNHT